MANVKTHQQLLNTWTKRYVPSLTPLTEDGAGGPLTGKRISEAKWFIGLPDHRNSGWSPALEWMLHHFGKTKDGVIGPDGLKRGSQRRAAQKAHAKKAHDHAVNHNGLVVFDGLPCAAWIARWLEKARAHGWTGRLVSGYRDPAYSTSLCRRICGAPTCPGRCAGATSHHVGIVEPAGAADVTQYIQCAQVMREIGSPLHNALPADKVHLSATGT